MTRPHQSYGARIAAARYLKSAREGKRVSQKQAARAVGVSAGTWTAWEVGKQRPEGGNLDRICAYLGVTPAALEGGEPLEGDASQAAAWRKVAALVTEIRGGSR